MFISVMDWTDLFGEDADIPGLVLMKEALSHDQQMQLLNGIIHSDFFQGSDQVMQFGHLPSFMDWIIPWTQSHPDLFPPDIMSRTPLFNQTIINLYRPGQGIKSHIDLLRFDDGIIIISLLSSCVMKMKHGQEQYSLLLRPGDVLALSGEARYEWEHGIEETREDVYQGEPLQRGTRISITLRKMAHSSAEHHVTYSTRE